MNVGGGKSKGRFDPFYTKSLESVQKTPAYQDPLKTVLWSLYNALN